MVDNVVFAKCSAVLSLMFVLAGPFQAEAAVTEVVGPALVSASVDGASFSVTPLVAANLVGPNVSVRSLEANAALAPAGATAEQFRGEAQSAVMSIAEAFWLMLAGLFGFVVLSNRSSI
jgi:hypothetical protein